MKKMWCAVLSILFCFLFVPMAFASDQLENETITPVTKVQVEFRYFVADPINIDYAIPAEGGGYWQLAETYTATAGGSNNKKLQAASATAKKYSPTVLNNIEYSFIDSWVDNFGNTYGTSGKLIGKDFIDMFQGYQGPEQTLTIYAQYEANQKFTFTNKEIDNVANGSHEESHLVDSKTGYEYTFREPADIPSGYKFLYWDGGSLGKKQIGDTLIIPPNSLAQDTVYNFIATYEYTPISQIQIRFILHDAKGKEVILKTTDPSTEPITLADVAPQINGVWLYNLCNCTGPTIAPTSVDPIITTELYTGDPILQIKDIYGILNGEDGADGKNGKDGINGVDGKDGVDGKNGVDGKDGINGKDGTNGKDGIDGVNGVDGIDGVNGKDGANGKSAYEIAVENGFKGTAIEWLQSLVGPQGLLGEAGINGKNGLDGVNGVNGVNGANGKDGIDGKDGLNGKDGKDGLNGKNGVDGQNGLNGTDGKDGKDGADGTQGEKGDQGIPGVNGTNGRNGIDGRDGIDGINGANGQPGPQGIQGIPGPVNTIEVVPAGFFENDVTRIGQSSPETTTIDDNTNPLASGISGTDQKNITIINEWPWYWWIPFIIADIILLFGTIGLWRLYREKRKENKQNEENKNN